MIDITPNPIAISLGSFEIRWYGLAYVAAITAAAWVLFHLARRRGERTDIIVDSLIVVAIAALIGGRAYHVIDQWAVYYHDHLAQIVLPPYSGLGVFGGLFTGMLAVLWLARHYRVSFWRWGDIAVMAVLAAQVVGRWGNFANQELYGPPTTQPWGIAIDCLHRVSPYLCPAPGLDPAITAPVNAHFHPLFLYESLLSLLGFVVLLWAWNHFTARKRYLIPGDVALLYFVWYGLERSLLETLRKGYDWTLLGIPTAQLVGLGAAAVALAAIAFRHWYVRSHPIDSTPAQTAVSGEQGVEAGPEAS